MNTPAMERAKELLSADRRREIYQAAAGGYYVTHSPSGPRLTISEVRELERGGIVRENPACPGLFQQPRKSP